MKRTLQNAVICTLGVYLACTCAYVVAGKWPSATSATLTLIPALLLGLVFSGYLVIIRTQGGIRFVDARRTEQSKREAAKAGGNDGSGPTHNVNGLPMQNGFDANGNFYGSTANDLH